MFETAEIGQKIDKNVFRKREPEIRTALIEAQRALRARGVGVIIIVAGAEGAGKGEVVHRLATWFDPRGVETHAFWDETQEEREHPRFWRYWRAIPRAGSIAVMFGSWYTRAILDRARDASDDASYEADLHRIAALERMLTDDGVLIVKLWFHLSRNEHRKRLRKARSEGQAVSPHTENILEHYDLLMRLAERAVRVTDAQAAPWRLIESTDAKYRDLTAGETLLAAIRARLEERPTAPSIPRDPEPEPDAVTVLDRVDLSLSLSPETYRTKLDASQRRLSNLAWEARTRGVSTIAVFEGWDAAGKGGAIRRVSQAMDARLYRTVPVGAPTDEEAARHYLWRFWRHVPRSGYMTLFDRSWYGRVLVERVEGLAPPEAWQRAYLEINDFEEQLVDAGVVLLKFWMHISRDEQLRRFRERQETEWKKHKITAEDWRNREKWGAYRTAVDDMVARTSTPDAPWTLVAANDKRHARVQVLETFCTRLRDALDGKV